MHHRRKVAPSEVHELRDMYRVQEWPIADIAKRYEITDSCAYENIRALEAAMGLKAPRVRKKKRGQRGVEFPTLFPTQRELDKRREERKAQLDQDPDVLRYREEKARRASV